MDSTKLIVLIAVWALYAVLHSVLASLSAKRLIDRHFPALTPYYRIGFNTLAAVLLIPPLWLTLAWRGEPLWQWQGTGFFVTTAIALSAGALFVWSLRFYDSGEFFGLRQVKEHRKMIEDQESLIISPLHRYVRHPWYSLGLALIWTRDMDPALLTASLCITLYFIIGSRLEERRLVAYHGEAYRLYQERVASLFPLPWRILGKEEGERLERMSRTQSTQ